VEAAIREGGLLCLWCEFDLMLRAQGVELSLPIVAVRFDERLKVVAEWLDVPGNSS
jgi:hypothetical protein